MDRLATLIPDERGICDIHRQTTYAGGCIPRDHLGDLRLIFVGHQRRNESDRAEYESICIRISGGFDD